MAVHGVGVAAGHEQLDHVDDLWNGLGYSRERHGPQHVEGVHLPQVDGVIALGELRDRKPQLTGLPHHVVIDVRNVLDVPHVEGVELEVATDDIEGHKHQRVAQMSHVIRRDAADVHAHDRRLYRLERLPIPGQRVVYFEQRNPPGFEANATQRGS